MGVVASWVGHGDELAQLLPKKVEALAGQRVVAVSAGDKDSISPHHRRRSCLELGGEGFIR